MFEFREKDEVMLAQLKAWWMTYCEDTFDQIAPKIAAYSSHDLEVMGTGLVALTAADIADPLEARRFGLYTACAFYALGKVARLTGALERGVLPDPDSELDLLVYSIMMRRVRETGGWPA
jgi:hypothetical protein